MPTSVLLVRWNGGWHEVVSQSAELAYGRREGFLSLGAVQSVGEAVRLAEAELEDQFGKIRQQSTAEHRPADLTEVPYVGYKPSDLITTPDFNGTGTDVLPVQAMAVSEDAEGVVTFVPTLGDTILGIEDLQEAVKQSVQTQLPPGAQPPNVPAVAPAPQ